MWCGWLAAGVAGLFILQNQVSTMAGIPLSEALFAPELSTVLTDTRYGALWLARIALWLFIGLCLWLSRSRSVWRWAALGGATSILLLTSLFSHAAAGQDSLPSVAGDFAHLALACFWTGGLIAFFAVIDPVRRALVPPAAQVGQLAHFFSLCARVAVVGLLLTGFYAAWLLVTTFGALTTTVYGRLLAVKLLLLLPLLAIAAMNLLWVQHRLRANLPIWITRLRILIGAEILLFVAIFAIVGAMTSINPARNVMDQRALADAAAAAAPALPPAVPVIKPIAMRQPVDDLNVDLYITPGFVGNNEFHISLSSTDGTVVDDASLIRLRFANLTEELGQSELRIEQADGGNYSVSGANLSAPGDWQIRVSIQRPDQYDSVLDFEPHIEGSPPLPAPLPTPVPVVVLPSETASIQAWRAPALFVTGILALAAGALFLALQRFRFWLGPGVLASLLIVTGIVFIASAWVA
jgi:putative copper export protein